jgi:hypothetical protein
MNGRLRKSLGIRPLEFWGTHETGGNDIKHQHKERHRKEYLEIAELFITEVSVRSSETSTQSRARAPLLLLRPKSPAFEHLASAPQNDSGSENPTQ